MLGDAVMGGRRDGGTAGWWDRGTVAPWEPGRWRSWDRKVGRRGWIVIIFDQTDQPRLLAGWLAVGEGK